MCFKDDPLARLDIAQMLVDAGEIQSRGESKEVSAFEFRSDGLHTGIGEKQLFFFFFLLLLLFLFLVD
jgi:hypothetical protein